MKSFYFSHTVCENVGFNQRGSSRTRTSASTTADGEPATEDEIRELQHVAASLPVRVWLAAAIGMAERFAYYSTQTLFCTSSFRIKANIPGDLIPGTLGLGNYQATTGNLAFTVAVNLLPWPTSILVDGRLGRYRALQIFTV
ncbi:putative PTR family peptide transporter [Aspergillus undulatus]|uniref:putative PTR family peptide transporter n=1 Tax=Aspergillus undulatus TaxID=1810928 RepID=UPI003CCCACAB